MKKCAPTVPTLLPAKLRLRCSERKSPESKATTKHIADSSHDEDDDSERLADSRPGDDDDDAFKKHTATAPQAAEASAAKQGDNASGSDVLGGRWSSFGCYFTPYRGTQYRFRSAEEMLALSWYTGECCMLHADGFDFTSRYRAQAVGAICD